MRLAAAVGVVGLALIAGLPPAIAHAAGGSGLQPFQMVRSLQLVQDRIASGDHAALPMQRKLLEMIDAKLREGDSAELGEPHNFRAMLVYAMSGGNPTTIEAAMARLDIDSENRGIGAGILNYLTGRPKEAQTALAAVDPMLAPPELGAFLALVKGSLVALEQPKSALTLFDQARLLGPGTLVEEAALRRIVGICGTTGDAERFVAASSQYVRNYLRSPYASQFADSFVSGIVTLNASLGLDRIEKIVAMMDGEQQQVIYLRVARRAAIDGLNELSAFASEKAERKAMGRKQEEDPRALLYSSLASVTSGSIEEVQAKIDRIDRSKLSDSDRRLLDAVQAVAAEVIAEPPVPNPKAIVSPAGETAKPGVAPVAGADPARAGGVLVAAPRETPAIETAKADETTAAPDPATALVAETRKKLEAIDKLLGEAAK
ncbi:chemotaxis protein MotC [Allomesorhizobium camelthorni]|uniref:Chemotaxis protein MotC n=1 Tax=Allomesorhizobium camelthorni TaxID=475069 RepID=A0A6G4WBJ1_9HYPH|nr:chemotaxis protein MotC [Mesorhizobium camelthorni]NGO51698.1 chemotaxis protein MotC [Mesorhizobium camelthorni]